MENNTIKFETKEEDVGIRLDIILSRRIDYLTRSNLKKIIELKQVKINNIAVSSPAKKIKLNDSISLQFSKKVEEEIKPSNINLEILYEDKDLIVLNKKAGMVVHPGAGNYENTLVNALMFKYKNKLSDINGFHRPGIVHRIDKETSGLLVVAKNNFSHSKLGEQFSNHSVHRKYFALIWGVLRPIKGKISTLIGRNKKNRQLMTVSEVNGKKAITNYFTLQVFNIKDIPKISLVEFELETGRTHQIRVHMQYKGNPILGDKQYGKKKLKFKKINKDFEKKLNILNRQALHAKTLGFVHPANNKFVNFESKIPNDFQKLLNLLTKLDT